MNAKLNDGLAVKMIYILDIKEPAGQAG